MELGGSGRQILDDVVVQFQCADSDFVTNLLNGILKQLKDLIELMICRGN